MAERIEDILARCIADVKAGRAGIEDCLARYPRFSDELEPLLRLALSIEPPAEVEPSQAFKARARADLITRINAERAPSKATTRHLPSPTNPFSPQSRLRFAAVAAAFIIGIASATGGTAYASQDALPGDILYPEKTFIEDVGLFFSFSAESKAETHLDIADTRIEEMSRLPEDRGRFVEGMMESYQYHLEQGLDIADEQVGQGANMSGLIARFQERIAYQQGVLNTSCDQVQAQVRQTVRNAINVSAGQLDKANSLMVQAHMENAARIMNRVGQAAQSGDADEVDELLQQYDECLDAIVDAAAITQDGETLLDQARERLGNAFDQLPSDIPEEASDAIENAKQKTMQGLDKATDTSDDGSTLEDVWNEFDTEWGEFMNQYQGEGAPGSEEWQNSWQEFDQAWQGTLNISPGNGGKNGSGSGNKSATPEPQPTVVPTILPTAEVEIISTIIPLP
ncbi:MAG: DUF5667 domain-containing protein [Chloroflexota bacterium]|nr:DUF5667 domain-containing protein [Chloroflexota bacterium]